MEVSIIELCHKLNKSIHDPLFHNFYNIPNELNYIQTFTSIDLVEDSQIAIMEFERIKPNGIRGRSTLLIYGLLQSLFLQQDGLYHLYKCITNNNVKQNDFFNMFSFDKKIRNVRNDIAGHPTNRNRSEYYYIVKGATAKYYFSYAGYKQEFRKVEVDLKSFISKQFDFAQKVLLFIQDDIKIKIEMKKGEYKKTKLTEMTIGEKRYVELIYRGIRDKERNFQGELGISGIIDIVERIKKELNLRYNENLSSSISEVFRMIDYILLRFNKWQSENKLFGNDDAEIFLDSLGNQLNELEIMLKEIDIEFNE